MIANDYYLAPELKQHYITTVLIQLLVIAKSTYYGQSKLPEGVEMVIKDTKELLGKTTNANGYFDMVAEGYIEAVEQFFAAMSRYANTQLNANQVTKRFLNVFSKNGNPANAIQISQSLGRFVYQNKFSCRVKTKDSIRQENLDQISRAFLERESDLSSLLAQI